MHSKIPRQARQAVDTALLRERRITGAWLRREPAARENGVVLVSLLRREKQDAHIVSEHATSSSQEKKVSTRDNCGPTQRRRPATPQPTLHYPQAHHRRKPHCLADESRMSAILIP